MQQKEAMNCTKVYVCVAPLKVIFFARENNRLVEITSVRSE